MDRGGSVSKKKKKKKKKKDFDSWDETEATERLTVQQRNLENTPTTVMLDILHQH
jgi:hypothetical protein